MKIIIHLSLCVGRYFINFTGQEPDETGELAQRPHLIRSLSLEERAVSTFSRASYDLRVYDVTAIFSLFWPRRVSTGEQAREEFAHRCCSQYRLRLLLEALGRRVCMLVTSTELPVNRASGAEVCSS